MGQLTEISGPFVIKNFILSENIKVPEDISVAHPFMFDGIILGLCIKGSGHIRINFKEYEIEQNSILTILPDQIFKMEKQTDDFMLELLFFSFDFIVGMPFPKDFDIIMNMGEMPLLNVSRKMMQDLLEFHSFIVKQYNKREQPYREVIVKSLLFSLVVEVGSIYKATYGKDDIKKDTKSSRQEELTDRFFKLLMQHYKQERSVSFYADKLCLTAKYLSFTIKKVTGHSILEWINEAIIIESKKRLKTTDMTVQQISEDLNFPNPSFFGRFFKQYVGTTPLKYRNE